MYRLLRIVDLLIRPPAALNFAAKMDPITLVIPNTETAPTVDTIATFDGSSKNPSTASWSVLLPVVLTWLNVTATIGPFVDKAVVGREFMVD